MNETKIGEIWWWLGEKQQFENGVTNKQVIEKFGIEYSDAWKLLKQRSRYNKTWMFYEDKKWFRWHKN